eukprot:15453150-Alexandrium_andersonii.AAC.2
MCPLVGTAARVLIVRCASLCSCMTPARARIHILSHTSLKDLLVSGVLRVPHGLQDDIYRKILRGDDVPDVTYALVDADNEELL